MGYTNNQPSLALPQAAGAVSVDTPKTHTTPNYLALRFIRGVYVVIFHPIHHTNDDIRNTTFSFIGRVPFVTYPRLKHAYS